MKLTIRKYQIEVRQREYSAGNDGGYYFENVDRYMVVRGASVLVDNIEYLRHAEDFIRNWSLKDSTAQLKKDHLSNFKKLQAKELSAFKGRLDDWGNARNERNKLIREGKPIPEKLRSLTGLLYPEEK